MKKTLLFLFVCSLVACNENPKPTENSVINADSIPVSASIRTIKDSIPTDSLVVLVDSTGHITMGNQKINMENLATKLEDSLNSIKQKYGRLPDTVLLRKKGDVLMGTRGAINDLIMEAKQKVKKEK